jgi:hypothetical protein
MGRLGGRVCACACPRKLRRECVRASRGAEGSYQVAAYTACVSGMTGNASKVRSPFARGQLLGSEGCACGATGAHGAEAAASAAVPSVPAAAAWAAAVGRARHGASAAGRNHSGPAAAAAAAAAEEAAEGAAAAAVCAR